MSTISKSEVLKIFKALHKARLKTFRDDYEMLTAFRDEINAHFKNNKTENDPVKVKELYKQAVLAEDEIRTKILQAVEIEPGRHQIRITEDHCVDDPSSMYKKQKFKVKEKSKSDSSK